MQVRLGNGFAKKTLDKHVQRMVVATGARARQMLERKCLLARTDDAASKRCLLTLLIVDGDVYREARRQLVGSVAQVEFL